MITRARLREVLHYDPETGIFTWLVRPRNFRREIGDEAGYLMPNGYIMIGIDGVTYLAHRLAWFYVHGVWPKGWLDHENRNRAANWLANLRESTPSQNIANRAKMPNNTSGYKGVTFDRSRGKWMAQIEKDGRCKHLGRHATKEQAHAAYVKAAEAMFGEFAEVA